MFAAKSRPVIPAIVDRESLSFVMPHSAADLTSAARLLTEIGGLKKVRQYNMKGMGTVTSSKDLGQFLSLGRTPHFECTAEVTQHEDLAAPHVDIRLEIDLLRAFGPQAAQMAPAIAEMVEEAREGLVKGDASAMETLNDLADLVAALAETRKLERAAAAIAAAHEGRIPDHFKTRIETAMGQTSEKIGALTLAVMDRGKLPPQIPVLVAARLGALAMTFDIPSPRQILQKIETRMQPDKALEAGAVDVMNGLQAALKAEGLPPELRDEIEAVLARLENTDEGKALSFEDTQALRGLLEVLAAADIGALPAAARTVLTPLADKIDILLDANTVFKAAQVGVPVAQMRAIETTQIKLDDLKQALAETPGMEGGAEGSHGADAGAPDLISIVAAIDRAIAKLDTAPGNLDTIYELIALQSLIDVKAPAVPALGLPHVRDAVTALAAQIETARPVQEILTAKAMGIDVAQVKAIVGTLVTMDSLKTSVQTTEPALAEKIEQAVQTLKENPGSLEAIHDLIVLQSTLETLVATAPAQAPAVREALETLTAQVEAVRPVQETLTAQAMGLEVAQVQAIVATMESVAEVKVAMAAAEPALAERIEQVMQTLKENPGSLEAIQELIVLQSTLETLAATAPEAKAPAVREALETLTAQVEAVRPVQETLTAQAMGLEVAQVQAIVATMESVAEVKVAMAAAEPALAERIEQVMQTLKENPGSLEAIQELIVLQSTLETLVATAPEAQAPAVREALETLTAQVEAVRPVQETLTAQAMGLEVAQVQAIVATMESVAEVKVAMAAAEPALAERIEQVMQTLKENPGSLEAIQELIVLQSTLETLVATAPEVQAPAVREALETLTAQVEAVRPVQETLTAQAMGLEVAQVQAIVATMESVAEVKVAMAAAEPALAERIEQVMQTLKENPGSLEAIQELVVLQANLETLAATAPEAQAPAVREALETLTAQVEAVRPVQETLTAQAMGLEVAQVQAIVATMESVAEVKVAMAAAEPALAERIEQVMQTLKENPGSLEAIQELIVLQSTLETLVATAPEVQAPAVREALETLTAQVEAVRPVQETLTAQAMGLEVAQVQAIVATMESVAEVKVAMAAAEPALAERIEQVMQTLKENPGSLEAIQELVVLQANLETLAATAPEAQAPAVREALETLTAQVEAVRPVQETLTAQAMGLEVAQVQEVVAALASLETLKTELGVPAQAQPQAIADVPASVPQSPAQIVADKIEQAMATLKTDPANIEALIVLTELAAPAQAAALQEGGAAVSADVTARIQAALAPALAVQQEILAQKLDLPVADVAGLAGMMAEIRSAAGPVDGPAAQGMTALPPENAAALMQAGEKMQAALETLMVNPADMGALKELAQARQEIARLMPEPQGGAGAGPHAAAEGPGTGGGRNMETNIPAAEGPKAVSGAVSPAAQPEMPGLAALDRLVEARIERFAAETGMAPATVQAALGGDAAARAEITDAAQARTVAAFERMAETLGTADPALAAKIVTFTAQIRESGLETALAANPDIKAVLNAAAPEGAAPATPLQSAVQEAKSLIQLDAALAADKPAVTAATVEAGIASPKAAAPEAGATDMRAAGATAATAEAGPTQGRQVAEPAAPVRAESAKAPADTPSVAQKEGLDGQGVQAGKSAQDGPQDVKISAVAEAVKAALAGEIPAGQTAASVDKGAPKAEIAGVQTAEAGPVKMAETAIAGAHEVKAAPSGQETAAPKAEKADAAASEAGKQTERQGADKADGKGAEQAAPAEGGKAEAGKPDTPKVPGDKVDAGKGADAAAADAKVETPHAESPLEKGPQEPKAASAETAKAQAGRAEPVETVVKRGETSGEPPTRKDDAQHPLAEKGEALKGDAPRAEGVTQETPKEAGAKAEPLKAEASKGETVKNDAPRAEGVTHSAPKETGVKVEPLKAEAAKGETLKNDAPRAEGATQSAPKETGAKVEPLKAEASKGETVKNDAPRAEGVTQSAPQETGAKVEPLKAEASKGETVKNDAPRAEGATQSAPKETGAKVEPLKAEASKGEMVKGDATRAEGATQSAPKETGAKVEPLKAEASKGEMVKGDATRAEGVTQSAPKETGAKVEPLKAEAAKSETVKNDAPRAEVAQRQDGPQETVARVDAPRNDTPRAEGPKPVEAPKQEQAAAQPPCTGGPNCPHCAAAFNAKAAGETAAPVQVVTATLNTVTAPANMSVAENGNIVMASQTAQGVREERVYTREDVARDNSAQQNTAQRLEKEGFIQPSPAAEERALQQAMAQPQQQAPQMQQPQQPQYQQAQEHAYVQAAQAVHGHDHGHHGHDHGHTHNQAHSQPGQQDFSLKEEFHKCGPDCWHNASTKTYEAQSQAAASYGTQTQDYKSIDTRDIDFAPAAPAAPIAEVMHEAPQHHAESPQATRAEPVQTGPEAKKDDHFCSGLCGQCKKCFVEAASVKQQMTAATDDLIASLRREIEPTPEPRKRKPA